MAAKLSEMPIAATLAQFEMPRNFEFIQLN
jgi:hypothetical protein